jgi:hypothetical protein
MMPYKLKLAAVGFVFRLKLTWQRRHPDASDGRLPGRPNVDGQTAAQKLIARTK